VCVWAELGSCIEDVLHSTQACAGRAEALFPTLAPCPVQIL